jgi:Tol biopolymer transport system component
MVGKLGEMEKSSSLFLAMVLLTVLFSSILGCKNPSTLSVVETVPHEGDWGIYELNLSTSSVKLLYSTSNEIYTSALRLNKAGDKLVFSQKVGGTSDDDLEIFSIGIDGSNLARLTSNSFWDLYPAWSPDGASIAFLSKREHDLDIYVMGDDGSDVKKLFDSGDNDADIDWAGDSIVFTSQFSVWKIRGDGTNPTMITNPGGRGEWGKANLPKGDYDPRLSRDGKKIVFERLEDVNQPNGGYNFFTINIDGTGETRLTNNSYAQGLASWSHSGGKIAYIIAAIEGVGKYDMYMMNSDGTENHDITPRYFPPDLLCYSPVFSKDDTKMFFIGRWWK